MDNLDFLERVARQLHKINFGKDGIIPMKYDGDDYNRGCWVKNGNKHNIDTLLHCCDFCDDYKGNVLKTTTTNGEQFTNISHGTHMLDFLAAHGEKPETVEGWSTKPVVFVMENPSGRTRNDYYVDPPERYKNGKCPTRSWYWLSRSYEGAVRFEFPNYFVAQEYGRLVYSIMKTFRIANGYLTNMVKCGVGVEDENGDDTYVTTNKYNKDIIYTCINKRLREEISALQDEKYANKDVVIFAFGKNTCKYLNKYLKDNRIYLLPHPSAHITNAERRKQLLNGINGALRESNFYEGHNSPDIYDQKGDYSPKIKINKDKLVDIIISNRAELVELIKHEKITDIELEEKSGYLCGKITYYIEETNNYVYTLILKAKVNKKSKPLFENKCNVNWVSYDFVGKAYYAYCGKNGKSDTIMTSAEEAECDLLKVLKRIVDKIEEK